MKAVTWHGQRDVRVDEHPDPIIMGQANVPRWVDDLLPITLDDEDPLDLESFHSHRLPLADAPHAYEIFQKKEDGAIKILLKP